MVTCDSIKGSYSVGLFGVKLPCGREAKPIQEKERGKWRRAGHDVHSDGFERPNKGANNNLQSAEADFAQRNLERDRNAALQARIQKVRDQASANNIPQARVSLDALRNELPADHNFLTTEGPELIAQAHIRLAETDERAGRYESALDQIALGEAIAPGYSLLRDVRARITTAADEATQEPPEEQQADDQFATLMKEHANLLMAAIERSLNSPASITASTIVRDLGDLKGLSGDEFTARETRLVSIAVGQLDSIKDANAVAAERRLRVLREAFPTDQSLQEYRLPVVSVSTADACGNAALAGRGAASRGGSCRDQLGGGKRGPVMVVVPAGGPSASSFAITKYEVTISDYNTYCELTGCPLRTGIERSMPLTNISLKDGV